MADREDLPRSSPADADGQGRDGVPPAKSSWFLPALVTGLFGLAGVVAGGVVTWNIQAHEFNNQREATTAADRRIARGTARLMDIEFLSRVDAMNAALGRMRYPSAHISLATRLSAADQRLVASTMEATGWKAVSAASAKLGRAQRMLARHPGQALEKSDVEAARTYLLAFRKASDALARFETQAN